jgi:hypothetical protein
MIAAILRTLGKAYFQKCIRPTERRCQTRQQILTVYSLPGVSLFLDRHNSRRSRRLRPGNPSADGAGSNRHLRIVANAFRLAKLKARHHVKLVALFPKPHWGCYFLPVLTERREGNVSLAANGRRNRSWHSAIVAAKSRSGRKCGQGAPF